MARCNKWHKKRASRMGANYVVLITGSSESRQIISGGHIYPSNNTSSIADYYFCAKTKESVNKQADQPKP